MATEPAGLRARAETGAYEARLVHLSRFLSLVLRHRPDAIGLALDNQGWADVDELLARAAAAGTPIEPADLMRVVAENDKQRFALSADGTRIRASQGHSIAVDLALPPRVPPAVLFHGTASRFVASIRRQGLVAGQRHDVHLSMDEAAARAVGTRYGVPVVLAIDAARMAADGHVFRVSDNGVWLTERVPVRYIAFPGRRTGRPSTSGTTSGGFDLTELWAVDNAIAADMVRVFGFIVTLSATPTRLGLRRRLRRSCGSGARTCGAEGPPLSKAWRRGTAAALPLSSSASLGSAEA